MTKAIEDMEAAYKAEHPYINWEACDVTFTMSWPDRSKPPVFTAQGWVEKVRYAY